MKMYILRVQNLYMIFILLTKVSSTRMVLDQPGLRSETPIYQKQRKETRIESSNRDLAFGEYEWHSINLGNHVFLYSRIIRKFRSQFVFSMLLGV